MSYRITVIEDNEPDMLLLQDALKRSGLQCEITTFSDGERACAFVDSLRSGQEMPHLILLDLNLPRIDGMEVVEHIRKKQVLNDVPLVIWSSGTSVSEQEVLERHKIAMYIVKPATYSEFMAVGENLKQILSASKAASSQ